MIEETTLYSFLSQNFFVERRFLLLLAKNPWCFYLILNLIFPQKFLTIKYKILQVNYEELTEPNIIFKSKDMYYFQTCFCENVFNGFLLSLLFYFFCVLLIFIFYFFIFVRFFTSSSSSLIILRTFELYIIFRSRPI